MVYKKTFFPEILIHPWETLKDVLDWEMMSQSELSLRTEISEKHISNIIKGKAGITPETALKFHKVFWISVVFWNNLQKSHDEDKARLWERDLMKNKLEEENEILYKIKDWYKNLEWLWFFEKIIFHKKNEEIILDNLYSFFWVTSLRNILEIFNIPRMWLNFKKSNKLKLNEYNLSCWLRAWELRAEKIETWEYSKNKLAEVLVKLKEMTKKEKVDMNKIQDLLANVWIYFSFVEWFKNVPVFWITRKYRWKAFIQVSDKGKKADWFWFALFHELAHVQLHLHKKNDILINVDDKEEQREKEANNWAWNYFIADEKYQNLKKIFPVAKWKLAWVLWDFAKENWIWRNILAWRLAFDNDWYSELSHFRTKLETI